MNICYFPCWFWFSGACVFFLGTSDAGRVVSLGFVTTHMEESLGFLVAWLVVVFGDPILMSGLGVIAEWSCENWSCEIQRHIRPIHNSNSAITPKTTP